VRRSAVAMEISRRRLHKKQHIKKVCSDFFLDYLHIRSANCNLYILITTLGMVYIYDLCKKKHRPGLLLSVPFCLSTLTSIPPFQEHRERITFITQLLLYLGENGYSVSPRLKLHTLCFRHNLPPLGSNLAQWQTFQALHICFVVFL